MDSDETDGADGRERSVAEPIVRPFGYVEDRPVIRRIGECNLYLGNGLAAHSDHHDRTFQFVLSVSREEYPLTTHHHPLVDGPDNDFSEFEAAVDTARALYRQEGQVLVHCKAGISRSSTIIGATLAAEENLTFHDGLAIVQNARPCAVAHPALHELAVIYLAAQS